MKQTIFTAILLAMATLIFTGCNPTKVEDEKLPAGKYILFYDQTGGALQLLDTNTSKVTVVDDHNITDTNSTLVYWYDANVSVEKIIMTNDYNYTHDGNLTHEKMDFLTHIDEGELHGHPGAEFDPDSNDFNTTVKDKKAAVLARFNAYQKELNATRQKVIDSNTSITNENICQLFAPHQNEDHLIFALTTDAKLHLIEHNHSANPETYTYKYATKPLSQATECKVGESGMTAYGAHGVMVYLKSSGRVYMVDSHDGAKYHEHSAWNIQDTALKGFVPTTMVGIDNGGAEHDHDDHDH